MVSFKNHPPVTSIKNWIILISGFTQSIERATGFEKLWLKIRPYSEPYTSMMLCRWSDDFDAVADMIWRLRPDDNDPNIYCFCYSWGCGEGFQNLSASLRARGLSIDSAVLCDPVYHSKFAPWRAIFSFQKLSIEINDNVKHVYWLRQVLNRPQGHDLRAKDTKATTIEEPIIVKTTHQYMDDSKEFHSLCLRVLDDAFRED